MISKEVIIDENGNTIHMDRRNFNEVVDFQLAHIKAMASAIILGKYPEFKQRNAALGILSEQERQEMANFISSIRDKTHELEAQIKNITWDGQESTRAAACDAVQSYGL